MTRSRWLWDDDVQEWVWAPNQPEQLGLGEASVETLEQSATIYTPDGKVSKPSKPKRQIGFQP